MRELFVHGYVYEVRRQRCRSSLAISLLVEPLEFGSLHSRALRQAFHTRYQHPSTFTGCYVAAELST